MPVPEKKVALGMSGGVDSSLAAALLRERGFEVVGVTLRLLPCEDDSLAKTCCGAGALESAAQVARHLGIEHRVLDCRREFSAQVLEPAWRDYRGGRTPNPCVLCNSRVRFPWLARAADEAGAAWLATGHYARTVHGAKGIDLSRGADARKDQSYFLFAVAPRLLSRTIFPLGEMEKGDVRRRARSLKLPAAERAESQDACLALEGESFAELLRLRFGGEARSGEIVDRQGRVLGRHAGVHLFTIGQRRGLGVAGGRSLYVVDIDAEAARVVVGDGRDLSRDVLVADGASWIERPAPGPCQAQIRYRHRPAVARLEPLEGDKFRLHFTEPQRAVTPGQAAVVYRGDRLLGGGWIT